MHGWTSRNSVYSFLNWDTSQLLHSSQKKKKKKIEKLHDIIGITATNKIVVEVQWWFDCILLEIYSLVTTRARYLSLMVQEWNQRLEILDCGIACESKKILLMRKTDYKDFVTFSISNWTVNRLLEKIWKQETTSQIWGKKI